MNRVLAVILLCCSAVLVYSAQADVFKDATKGWGRDISSEYFGMTFHGLVPLPSGKYPTTQWPQPPINFSSIRLWDTTTRWADIAPNPGQWDFERLDRFVGVSAKHGAEVVYVLGSTPRWASARPDESCPYGLGCSAEPVRMAHWEEYVRRVAKRYRGRIRAYELWNEPNVVDNFPNRGAMKGYFFTGSVAQLVEMARVARKVLDEEDPAAILTTPAIVNAPIILDQFFAAGGKQYVQAVAYHFYSSSDVNFVEQIVAIRTIMERHGAGQLPLWNTEAGFPVYPERESLPPGAQRLTRDEAAARMAQVLILGAAAGLDRFYYYAWENRLMGLVGFNGEPLSGFDAMQKVQKWLLGSRMAGCSSLGNKMVRCDGENAGQRFVIAWADTPINKTIPLPPGWRVASVEALLGTALIQTKTDRRGNVTLLIDKAPVRVLLAPVQH
ncbi:MAG: hypothetical protein GZ085_04615 [Sulfuriferula multivorans]|uniref:Glycoside hydrolase family 5 domain-containing protein n=1 Tax=Sulfuriferula multivorans TaxID=1559896 RepID=A0A7C9K1I3_9PROT|nr:hypothetical protein [Sulfuriferula multivorans]